MLTRPVAAAQAAVAMGASGLTDTRHVRVSDTRYVEVWELKLYFYPSAGGLRKGGKI